MAKIPAPDRESDYGYGAGFSRSRPGSYAQWKVNSWVRREDVPGRRNAVTRMGRPEYPMGRSVSRLDRPSDILVMPDRLAPARPIVYRRH